MRGVALACALLAALLGIKILWPESSQTHVVKINTAPRFEVVSSADIPVDPPCSTSSALDESCANELF